jgi:hypothetical protein
MIMNIAIIDITITFFILCIVILLMIKI